MRHGAAASTPTRQRRGITRRPMSSVADHPLVRAAEIGQNRDSPSIDRRSAAVLAGSVVAVCAGASSARVDRSQRRNRRLAGVAHPAAPPHRQRQSDRALDLILQGRETLPVTAIQRQRRRLVDPRTRLGLARAFETVIIQQSHDSARRSEPEAPLPLFDRQESSAPANAELAAARGAIARWHAQSVTRGRARRAAANRRPLAAIRTLRASALRRATARQASARHVTSRDRPARKAPYSQSCLPAESGSEARHALDSPHKPERGDPEQAAPGLQITKNPTGTVGQAGRAQPNLPAANKRACRQRPADGAARRG